MDNSRSRFFEKSPQELILSKAKQRSFTNELVHKFCWNLISFILGFLMTTSNESLATPLGNPLINVKQVSNRCVINDEDKLYCWGGYPGDGSVETKKPIAVNNDGLLGGYNVRSVSSSNRSICAINTDDELYCWGKNSEGQLGDTTEIDKKTPTLVRKAYLGGKGIKSVSVGSYHTCAINNDGKLYCWGYNYDYQLGTGDSSPKNKTRPTIVDEYGLLGGLGVKSVSVGSYHTCAINIEDKLYCWGNNQNGQLGDGTITGRVRPTIVNGDGLLGGVGVVSVSAGSNYTCGLNNDDKLYCWGTTPAPVNGDGFLGGVGVKSINGSCAINDEYKLYCKKNSEYELQGDGLLGGGGIKSVSGSCAINNDNKLYCWGNNSLSYSLLDTEKIKIPVPIYDISQEARTGTISGKTIESISVGSNYTCGLNSEKKLFCWGKNDSGQLGDGTNEDRLTPILSYYGSEIKSISAGTNHTCVISKTNKLACWGKNDYGQLGDGTSNDSTEPVAVYSSGSVGYQDVISVSANYRHTCAINSKNRLYCWGENGGRLGNGEDVSSTWPVAVSLNSGFKSVSAGYDHTCAITSTYSNLYCWGNYGLNETYYGESIEMSSSTPILVRPGVASVSAGYRYTCLIDNSNELYCWGNNESGQLGDGTTENKKTFTLVNGNGLLGGVGVKSVSTKTDHTCAINNDNRLYCWGKNNYGQLGDGTTTDKLTPTLVFGDGLLGGVGVKSISVGENHSCAVNNDDMLYCWGDNSYELCTKGNLIYSTNDTSAAYLVNHCGVNPSNYAIGGGCSGGVGVCSRMGTWNCSFPELREIECTTEINYPNRKGEICSNNLDDNCNGTIDEEICTVNDCSTDEDNSLISSTCSVGVGACETNGTYYCDINDEVTCDAVEGSPGDELCNGIDDDCDGLTDEDFDKEENCTVGIGACANTGKKICSVDTLSTVCNVEAGTPGTEICGDSIDNDCDEATDEDDCICTDPQNLIETECSDGNGVCKSYGQYVCNKLTGAVECNAVANNSVQTIEICADGKDNDCDGGTDEDECICLDSNNLLNTDCSAGVGACEKTGTNVCNKTTGQVECNAVAGISGAEICGDNIDNDCDSVTDEDDCICLDPHNLLDTNCSAGIGACENLGVNVCNKTTGVVECNAVAGNAGTETCANMESDDDCDGTADNIPNLGNECTGESVGLGACANTQGTYACNGDDFICLVNALPSGAEICADTIDNDCDGDTDEAECNCLDPNHILNTSCSDGVGACENPGKNVCNTATGEIECNAVAGTAGTEICGDNIDNDCDGAKDEADCICLDPDNLLNTECSVGVGACSNSGEYVCNKKTGQVVCNIAAKDAGVETCANMGSDDDCDGVTDNIPNLGMDCTGESVGIGACANSQGTYICSGDKLICNVVSHSAGSEICGDNVDNDCDGEIDEGCIIDHCPSDPNKTEPGVCGCGVADIDSDSDGVLDCKDGCPNDSKNKDLTPPIEGCFVNESEVPEKFDPKVIVPEEQIVTPKTKLLSPYVIKNNTKATVYFERFAKAQFGSLVQSNKKTTFKYEVRVTTTNKKTKTSKIVRLKSSKNKLTIKLKAKVVVKVQYRVMILQGKKKKVTKWSKNITIKK